MEAMNVKKRKTDRPKAWHPTYEPDKERHRTVGISFSASLQPVILIVIPQTHTMNLFPSRREKAAGATIRGK